MKGKGRGEARRKMAAWKVAEVGNCQKEKAERWGGPMSNTQTKRKRG